MKDTVLLVNDNEYQSQQLRATLQERLGYQVISAIGAEDALSKLMPGKALRADVIIIDMADVQADSFALIRAVRMAMPAQPIMLMMSHGDNALMAEAYQLGVNNIILKPIWLEQLRLSLSNLLSIARMSQYITYLEHSRAGKIAFSDIIGDSPAIRHALHLAREAAMGSAPVWISGEAGSGKELLAKAIHAQGRRGTQPAVVVECSELARGEAEKLLFGSEAEAITGKLAEAGEGTVILKHVDQLPQAAQRRLLALMDRTAEGKGNTGDDHCHARIIMTQTESQKPYLLSLDSLLPDMREACGTVIDMPPLRERAEDVRLLTQHYLRMYCASEHKNIRAVSPEGLHYLERGLWHGNVRELMHVIWRAVLLCSHDVIEQGDLCLIKHMQPTHYAQRKGAPSACSNPILLDMQGRMRSLESIEREVIQFALMYAGGCMTHAARNLGIGRSTLYRRVHALKLDNYISRENQMTRPIMRISSKEHS